MSRIALICADAYIMRICANYAYMRILCVDAQMMRRCANDAYMRRVCVYAHITRIGAIRQRQQNGAELEPREPPSPGPEDTQPLQVTPYTVSITTFSPNQKHSIRINTQAHHAGPLGAADFPCLRQLPPPPEQK